MKSRYYVSSLTGSTLMDHDGRGMGPETTGCVFSQHRTLSGAFAALDRLKDGYIKLVVIDRTTHQIVWSRIADPELLAALYRLELVASDAEGALRQELLAACVQARAAIAKATGGES